MEDERKESDLNYLKIALEAQTKFEYYLIGLIFTLLALSIQSAKFGPMPLADIAELLGWLALLASGLIALVRLRDGVAANLSLAKVQELRERQEWYDQQAGHLDNETIERAIERLWNRMDRIDKEASALSTRRARLEEAQVSIFLLAVCLIIAARASAPLLSAVQALAK